MNPHDGWEVAARTFKYCACDLGTLPGNDDQSLAMLLISMNGL